jgi:hypothetical protein
MNGRQCRFDRRGTVAHHQIEDLNLAGLEARQGLLESCPGVVRYTVRSGRFTRNLLSCGGGPAILDSAGR